ncbi:hypothetical protein BC830DRAFT_1163828 [Chytriomyces sp. MP71]|nr:hypothetical protein BC830DRAFT_1163828 [Chytriomyces sp. MP71]
MHPEPDAPPQRISFHMSDQDSEIYSNPTNSPKLAMGLSGLPLPKEPDQRERLDSAASDGYQTLRKRTVLCLFRKKLEPFETSNDSSLSETHTESGSEDTDDPVTSQVTRHDNNTSTTFENLPDSLADADVYGNVLMHDIIRTQSEGAPTRPKPIATVGAPKPKRAYKLKSYDHAAREWLPSFVPADIPSHTAPGSPRLPRVSSGSGIPLFRLGEESHVEETAGILGVEKGADVRTLLKEEGISRWAAILAVGSAGLNSAPGGEDDGDFADEGQESVNGSGRTGSFKSKVRRRKVGNKSLGKRSSVASNVSRVLDYDETLKRDFILKLARALTMYGAPAHRLEYHLAQVSQVLKVEADFIIFPGVVMISYGGPNHKSNAHFMRASQGIHMGKLAQTNALCLALTQNLINVNQALDLLEGVRSSSNYPWWVDVMIFPMSAFTIALVLFQLSWAESCVAGVLGIFVGYLNLAASSYGSLNYLLEFLSSLVCTFVSRGIQLWLHSNGLCFRYLQVTLSAVALFLPGLPLTIAIIDLSSRNMVSGTVRMFGSLFTAMLLGFGMTIGGALVVWNSEGPDAGPTCTPTSQYWAFLFFIPMSMSLNLLFQASKYQWPIMVIVAAAGHVTSIFLGTIPQLQAQPTVVTAVASLVIGMTSNLYARFTNDVAIAPILSGILLQVPGSLSVKSTLGFFAANTGSGDSSTSNSINVVNGVNFTFQMLSIG